MLEWENRLLENGKELREVSPKLLEVNFSPDCVRACKYHPDFFNHIFQALFLEDYTDQLPVTRLL